MARKSTKTTKTTKTQAPVAPKDEPQAQAPATKTTPKEEAPVGEKERKAKAKAEAKAQAKAERAEAREQAHKLLSVIYDHESNIVRCACGCGARLPRRFFAPGHDARVVGWLSKGEATIKDGQVIKSSS